MFLFHFFFLFSFFLATLWPTEFPGQGSDLSCNCDLGRSCGNTRPLTHCTGPGIKPVSQCCRDTADPLVPQWELHAFLIFIFIYLYIYLFTCFLGLHLWHMEVPRLGVNWSYSCQPTPQPQQRRIRAASVTYTTAQGNTRSLTHSARPGMEPTTSCLLVGFVSEAPPQELHVSYF